MSWSRDVPEKPGWYWVRQRGGAPELVALRGNERREQRLYSDTLFGQEVDELEDEWEVEFWSEPLAPPRDEPSRPPR